MDSPGIEPGSPPRQGGVVPLDHEPETSSGLDGSRTHLTDLARVSRLLGTCQPVQTKRSVPELNRVFLLTEEVCCQNTYRPFRVSDPGWNRTSTFLVVTQASLPLDHGIVFLIQ